jgi:hypothetical protein
MTCPRCGEKIATEDVHEVDPHGEGGTRLYGGSTDATLNITTNYHKMFVKYLNKHGIWWLGGLEAEVTIESLQKAVNDLGTARDTDYWARTPGNAGHALSILLGWARKYPGGVWRVIG